jgi:uncharacterized protein (DUF2267 family)
MLSSNRAETEARFFEAIGEDAALPPWLHPVDAARVTLQVLLDRLTPGQAHVLVGALPPKIGALASNERHGRLRGGLVELVDRVAFELGVAPASAELVVTAVFRALETLVTPDLHARVGQQLPSDLRELWLAPTATPAVTEEDVQGDLDSMRQILGDIERSEVLPLRVTAREAFSTVMCLFARRLSGGETKELFFGLPRTIRPLVERCMLERPEKAVAFGADELFASVARDLGTELDAAEAIVDAVIAAVTRVLPREELEHVASQLPLDLRTLWQA